MSEYVGEVAMVYESSRCSFYLVARDHRGEGSSGEGSSESSTFIVGHRQHLISRSLATVV